MTGSYPLRGACAGRPARAWTVWAAAAAAALLSATAACREAARPNVGAAGAGTASEAVHRRLFDTTMDNWRHPERLDTDEAVRQSLDNLTAWLKTQTPPPDWKLDPMAAELLRPLAEPAPELGAIVQSLEKPRMALQLKSSAGLLEARCARLAALAKQGALAEVDRTEAEHEKAVAQMAQAIRDIGSAEQAAQADTEALGAFEQQFKDRGKLEQFRKLRAMAALLGEPARLRDPQRLALLIRQLRDESKDLSRANVDELVGQYTEQASRRVSRGMQLKSVVQFALLRSMLRQLDLLDGLVSVRLLRMNVGNILASLKSVAMRSGREDVAALAARLEDAVRRGDLPAVETVSRDLAALAKPRDMAELKEIGGQLADPAARLRAVAQRIVAKARADSWPNLTLLAGYLEHLAQQLQATADGLAKTDALTQFLQQKMQGNPIPDAPDTPDPRDLGMAWLSVQLNQLEGALAYLAETWGFLAGMDRLEFTAGDRKTLETAVLLSTVSGWSRGDEIDDVHRAGRLFDWTIRNILAEPPQTGQPDQARVLRSPWEVLIYGAGSSAERAGLFVLLAQQQGLDAALLSAPAAGDGGPAVEPLVGVLSEGKLYVFDPQLGLPIPAKNGVALDESGQLAIEPATLDELIADESLLRRLDGDASHRYRLTAAQIKRLVAEVEAPLPALSLRMRMVEGHASGEQRFALAASPSAQAERFRAVKALAGATYGRRSVDAYVQRMAMGEAGRQRSQEMSQHFLINPPEKRQFGALHLGRLFHLEGKFTGDESAVDMYQASRPSDDELARLLGDPRLRQTPGFDPTVIALSYAAKIDASYWLGLLSFDQRRYESAEDYLKKRTLEAARRYVKELPPQLSKFGIPPQLVQQFVARMQAWDTGATYNLGRVYEALRRYDDAIARYVENTQAVDAAGERLRARWLAELTGKKLPAGATAPTLPTLPDTAKSPDKPRPDKNPPSKSEPTKPSKPGPAKDEGKTPAQMPDLPDLPDLPNTPAKPEKPASQPPAKPKAEKPVAKVSGKS